MEDEYIQNLYQQIHFMDLELQILKDKVVEDEKNSGIGSLFDDDKTSHQHINLLKVKYAAMRREAEKKFQELHKQNLNVKGQEFMLESQIDVMKEQLAALNETEQAFKRSTAEERHKLQRDVSDISKERQRLEAEIRKVQAEHDKESDQNEKDILSKMQGDQGDEIKNYRYEQSVKMLTDLIAKKEAEEKVKVAELAAIEKAFADHKDLQAKLAETRDLRAKIEAAKVKF